MLHVNEAYSVWKPPKLDVLGSENKVFHAIRDP